jgi:hypothetical protein
VVEKLLLTSRTPAGAQQVGAVVAPDEEARRITRPAGGGVVAAPFVAVVDLEPGDQPRIHGRALQRQPVGDARRDAGTGQDLRHQMRPAAAVVDVADDLDVLVVAVGQHQQRLLGEREHIRGLRPRLVQHRLIAEPSGSL